MTILDPDNVAKLSVVRSQIAPDGAVIEMAERILTAAKEGRVRGITAILRMADESHDYMLVGRREPMLLIGQLHRLAHLAQLDADAQTQETKI